MSMSSVLTLPAPGWYPDPVGMSAYRWWDGSTWTEGTHDGDTAASAGQADVVAESIESPAAELSPAVLPQAETPVAEAPALETPAPETPAVATVAWGDAVFESAPVIDSATVVEPSPFVPLTSPFQPATAVEPAAFAPAPVSEASVPEAPVFPDASVLKPTISLHAEAAPVFPAEPAPAAFATEVPQAAPPAAAPLPQEPRAKQPRVTEPRVTEPRTKEPRVKPARVAEPKKPRATTTPAKTRYSSMLLAFPFVYPIAVGMVVALAYAGGSSTNMTNLAVIGGIAALVLLAPAWILAENDRKELIARGYAPAPSLVWMLLLPPVAYLIARRRVVGPSY